MELDIHPQYNKFSTAKGGTDWVTIPIKEALVPPGGGYVQNDPDTHDFALMVLEKPAVWNEKGKYIKPVIVPLLRCF